MHEKVTTIRNKFVIIFYSHIYINLCINNKTNTPLIVCIYDINIIRKTPFLNILFFLFAKIVK